LCIYLAGELLATMKNETKEGSFIKAYSFTSHLCVYVRACVLKSNLLNKYSYLQELTWFTNCTGSLLLYPHLGQLSSIEEADEGACATGAEGGGM